MDAALPDSPAKGLRVRAAAAADVAALLGLLRPFLEEQGRLEPTFRAVSAWEEGARTYVTAYLARPDAWVLLALHDERPAGFIFYGLSHEPLFEHSRVGHIADLFVLPEFRRHGAGRRLAEMALGHLRQSGAQGVQLQVHVRNSEGERFWRRLGFEPFLWRMKLMMPSDGGPAPGGRP